MRRVIAATGAALRWPRRQGAVSPVLLVAVVGVALSYYAFSTWRAFETATAESNFKATAADRLADLRRSIARPIDEMVLVEALVEATGPIDRTVFSHFAGTVLARNPEIRQLIWAQVRAGLAGVTGSFVSGDVLPEAADAQVGRDLVTLPGYGPCLAGTPALTTPNDRFCVRPLKDGLQIFAVLAVTRARLRDGDPPLWGVIAGRIHIRTTIGGDAWRGIRIFDLGATADTDLLHPGERADARTETIARAGGQFSDVPLGRTTWRLAYLPEKATSSWPSRESLLVLAGCLAMTMNLTGYMMLVLRRRGRIEILVGERTREVESALRDLRLSEQRLRDYVATASDWYWETGEDLRFTRVATQARDHGIEPGDLIGLDRLTADDTEHEMARRGETLAAHQMFHDLRYDYGTDRGLLTLSLSGTPVFGTDGTFMGYRGSARDITAQLQVEAKQRQARWTAEQANRSKSVFLATMSHEIRTPMNGVLGMVQLLGDTELNQEQRRMCDVIYRSGNALQQILNDILDYSKLEAGRISLELIGSSLIDVVNSVVDLMRGTARAKGLEIAVDVADGIPPPVMIDPTRLRQVLFNLVSNAIKFSELGVVTIRLRGECREPGQVAVTLAVADQGIGISEEARQRLFMRFSQADDSTTRRFGGTGLGLAITRELVLLMGGTIGLVSDVGAGSTFTVRMTVPVAEPIDRPTAPPRPAGDAARARVLEILVAEDNDINQEVIGGLLRGHRLTMVKDGGEAVEAARKARFDLILMDVMMPVMNGLQATAAIRALPPPEAAVPIIALTANSMSGDRERYLAAGMNAYVSKPIERRTLLEVIETVIGEPVWQSAATETAAVPPLAPTTEAASEIDDFITSLEA